ncbi:MAG: Uncharacterized protein YtxJ, partial [uncultured Thermomicrobiales bacterium]
GDRIGCSGGRRPGLGGARDESPRRGAGRRRRDPLRPRRRPRRARRVAGAGARRPDPALPPRPRLLDQRRGLPAGVPPRRRGAAGRRPPPEGALEGDRGADGRQARVAAGAGAPGRARGLVRLPPRRHRRGDHRRLRWGPGRRGHGRPDRSQRV